MFNKRKIIRYSLDMGQGVKVNSVEELREHFYMPQVLSYLENGQLSEWLRHRNEKEMAEAVEALHVDDENLQKELCDLFAVEYDMVTVNIEEERIREGKLKLLERYAADESFAEHVDNMAFTMDDLDVLLDKDVTNIYLCGARFEIPLTKTGMTYVGVNRPVVVISSTTPVDWEGKRIVLKNVEFDDKYQAIVNASCNSASTRKTGPNTEGWYPVVEKKWEALSDEYTFTTSMYERRIKKERYEIYLAKKGAPDIRKVICQNAISGKSCDNYIYFITENEAENGVLHAYNVDSQEEFTADKIVEGGESCILACKGDWIICAAKEKVLTRREELALYFFNSRSQSMIKKRLKEMISEDPGMFPKIRLAIAGDRFFLTCGKILYGGDLSTLELAEVEAIGTQNINEWSDQLIGDGKFLLGFWCDGNNYHYVKFDSETNVLADTCKIPYEAISFNYDMLYLNGKIYCLGRTGCVDEEQVALYSFDTVSHELKEIVAFKKTQGDGKGALREDDGRIYYEIDIASNNPCRKGLHVCDYVGGKL